MDALFTPERRAELAAALDQLRLDAGFEPLSEDDPLFNMPEPSLSFADGQGWGGAPGHDHAPEPCWSCGRSAAPFADGACETCGAPERCSNGDAPVMHRMLVRRHRNTYVAPDDLSYLRRPK